MTTKDFVRGANEFAGFAALAVAMAAGTGFYLNSRADPATAASVTRSSSDAHLLQAALGLRIGVPTVVEFMDFQCPPCRASYPKIKEFLANNPKARYRPVNFPLNFHQYAFGAAVAWEIATANGKRDQTFDDLFTGKTELDPASLNKYLAKNGLPALVGKPGSAPFKGLVQGDLKIAEQLKINATPTIFVLASDGTLTEVRGIDLIQKFLN